MSSSTSSISSTFPPLPVGWTQVIRKKRKSGTNNGDNDGWIQFCCDDPNCIDLSNEHRATIETNQSTAVPANQTDRPKMVSMKGKGLFCLHEIDCKWFQGHFIPTNITNQSLSSSSFGLLAVERDDVDKCLQCKDGGYREIDLTILSSTKSKTSRATTTTATTATRIQQEDTSIRDKEKENKRRKLKIDQLECTGGDMLRISTTSTTRSLLKKNEIDVQISFDAERIITGRKVEFLVRKYFSSLLPRKSKENNSSILEILPDCAIVTGDMQMKMPASFVYGQEKREVVVSDFDDWLE